MHLENSSAICEPFCCDLTVLTHLPLVPHICVNELGQHWFIVRRQAITWTNTELLSIGPLGRNFSEIKIKMQNFSFIKMHFNMSSEKYFVQGEMS